VNKPTCSKLGKDTSKAGFDHFESIGLGLVHLLREKVKLPSFDH